jgi:hypothetical protein
MDDTDDDHETPDAKGGSSRPKLGRGLRKRKATGGNAKDYAALQAAGGMDREATPQKLKKRQSALAS